MFLTEHNSVRYIFRQAAFREEPTTPVAAHTLPCVVMIFTAEDKCVVKLMVEKQNVMAQRNFLTFIDEPV